MKVGSFASSYCETKEGGFLFFLAGNNSAGENKAILIKCNQNGDVQWQIPVSAINVTGRATPVELEDGSVLINGIKSEAMEDSSVRKSLYLARISKDGKLIKEQNYEMNSQLLISSCKEIAGKGIFISYYQMNEEGNDATWTSAMIDAELNVLWENTDRDILTYSNVLVLNDGICFVKTDAALRSTFYKIDFDGKILSTKDLSVLIYGHVVPELVACKENILYLDDTGIKMLNQDGSLLWEDVYDTEEGKELNLQVIDVKENKDTLELGYLEIIVPEGTDVASQEGMNQFEENVVHKIYSYDGKLQELKRIPRT